VLLPSAEQHVTLWRRQLGLLLERGQRTFSALTDAAGDGSLPEGTRARLTALGQAVREQIDDVARVLGPALGGALSAAGAGLPRGVVEYIGYLYRDWAWPAVGYRENEAALLELARLLDGRELGRVLVLGAGACGLAYELHLRHGASQTIALDIDPYLLVIAERIVRGGAVRLTEASLKWIDADEVCRSWLLQASSGPLGRDAFRCVFADGVAPPFAAETFDTVLTPWFIDQVPPDLPAFVGALRRLLRPGGRWLNQGPLIYPEQTPFERRYARQELFELARAAGFEVGDWSRTSQRYLVSPLTGNGKLESVLSFVATRC
jgi:SAM-dependent methyltransferase